MWTPRRIVLLLTTLLICGVAYAGYARFLGSIDGLPNLPAKYLENDDKPLGELAVVESPTLIKLRLAFGENCPEMGSAYPTRLEIRESGIVFAAGMPQIGTEPTRFVKLAPLSVATFTKPKPAHEQVPGEVPEISTLHGDEGILEFDRPISSDREMLTGKAKLIGIEMRSNPDPHSTDPRNGRIIITNNQRYADSGRFLIMKTSGPVYHRTADHPDAGDPHQPHIWTNAAVEIINRDNLPRPLRGATLPTVPVNDDARLAASIADMAMGLHTPPPTITADGMKIFMKKNSPTPGKRKESGFAGIQQLIFNENVIFSLWTDGDGSFPGDQTPSKTKSKQLNNIRSESHAALMGGVYDGWKISESLKRRALIRIRTLGPFAYNLDENYARFDIAPHANPLVPNNVEVQRFLPSGEKDYLVCQRLQIDFSEPMKGTIDPKTQPGFKRLVATGSHVLIAAATEQLQAQGTVLVYENDVANKRTATILSGAPLSAVRGKNVLVAGNTKTTAELRLITTEQSSTEKITEVAIQGPGSIEISDDTTREKSLTATWQTSLTQARETINGIALDRLVFTGDGEFIDAKSGFRLKSDVLKLWLKAGEKSATPQRMQGLGRVAGTTEEAIIEETDFLTVMFLDKPVADTPVPPTVSSPMIPPNTSVPEPPQVSTPKKPSNPTRLSARQIDVWLNRQSDARTAKYELHEARCDDRVRVLQAPNDPRKSAVGIDIRGGGLLMKKRGTGHVMTVTGTADEIARVRFENLTICGTSVLIDQPANMVSVNGGGWMRMPSSSDLAGAAVKEKAEITVHWQTRMKFLGERRRAEFVGQVQAVQADAEGVVTASPTSTKSTVACHELNVTFDKPIYFTRLKRSETETENSPKVESIVCTPASEDADQGTRQVVYLEETVEKATKRVVKAQQIEAKLIDVRVRDDASRVFATGPGTTRMLALGTKEAMPGQNNEAATEREMKLTIVNFNGRLELTDKKGILQTAVFYEAIKVAQIPSSNLHQSVDELEVPPPRSVFLKCNNTFTVSTYRSKGGAGEDTRSMEAVDAAEFKTDDYIGIGHTITYDGQQVILRGYKDGQATLYRRQRGLNDRDFKSGNPLIYNVKTGQVSGAQSSGGQFTSPK